jgi:hypothetical protein
MGGLLLLVIEVDQRRNLSLLALLAILEAEAETD